MSKIRKSEFFISQVIEDTITEVIERSTSRKVGLGYSFIDTDGSRKVIKKITKDNSYRGGFCIELNKFSTASIHYIIRRPGLVPSSKLVSDVTIKCIELAVGDIVTLVTDTLVTVVTKGSSLNATLINPTLVEVTKVNVKSYSLKTLDSESVVDRRAVIYDIPSGQSLRISKK